MNALKSMMEATARVRRDGAEAKIPAEGLVVGDVVLIAAGDEVPADGRIVSASALQIDESALTGESVPSGKDASTLADAEVGAGRPVEHGLHAHPGHARQRRRDRDGHRRRDTGREDRPHALRDGEGGDAAHEADEHADALDRRRGGADDDHHVRARPPPRAVVDGAVQHRRGARDRGDPARAPDGRPGRPLARQRRAREAEGDREGPPVGRDARLHLGDQLGQDRDADDEPDDRRRGARLDRPLHGLRHRLQPRGHDRPRRREHQHARRRRPPLRGRERRQARRRQGRRRPDRGRAARPGAQGRARHRGHARGAAADRDAPVRPDLQADGDVPPGEGLRREGRHPLLRQGRGARR